MTLKDFHYGDNRNKRLRYSKACGVIWVCVLMCVYLEAASFGGVQDEELLEQVLTVSGHVEGNPIFATQHALPQFLEMNTRHRKLFLRS